MRALRCTLGLAALLVVVGPAVGPVNGQQRDLTPDRYGTAARAALEAFPDGADAAVVVSGVGFADGLAAAPVAAFFDAPILLTAPDVGWPT